MSSPAEIIDEASRYIEYKGAINSIIDLLKSELNTLNLIWSGDSYEAYYSEYEDAIRDIESFSSGLGNMSSSLYSLASLIEDILDDD